MINVFMFHPYVDQFCFPLAGLTLTSEETGGEKCLCLFMYV